MKNIIYRNICSGLTSLFMIVIIFGCSTSSENVELVEDHPEEEGIIEFTKAQIRQAGIIIGRAEKRNIGLELKVNGLIDVPPHGNFSINLPYGGFLKHTEMLSGTEVKKGQLLATIENPEFIRFQQEYQEGLAQREFLKAEYERQESLYREQVASGKKYQEAKSAYQSNEVRINATKEKLKLIGFNINEITEGKTTSIVNIYSPVSGSVKEVYANVGKYIGPQDTIMDITDTGDLHVELSVYENDIPKVSKGQIIRFTVANSPKLIREAEVFLIGKNVREDRSVTVHGHLTSTQEDLLPGMYISANIITGVSEVWAVPEESLVRFKGKHYIYSFINQIQENNQTMYQFEMIEVKKAMKEDGYVQIDLFDNNISIESKDIVTKGAFHVLSKAKNSEEEGHGH